MDTNVFISQLKPDDPYYEASKTIVKKIAGGDIAAETSVLTLLETASVASRLYDMKMAGKDDISNDQRKIFIVKTISGLASLKPRFIHPPGDSPFFMRSVPAELPQVFGEAILMSLLIPLRTFDLIHLAAARWAKQSNQELGAFVTGDNGILLRKREASKLIDVPVLSPKEYVQALGLE